MKGLISVFLYQSAWHGSECVWCVCYVVSVCVFSPIQCRLSGGQMTPCIITIIQERIANQRANNAAL